MKITSITAQTANPNRVNLFIDGNYRLSLDIFQVSELGLKSGMELDEARLLELEEESQYGKTYARALEYSLTRPHSAKEMRDYLWKKTRLTRTRQRSTGQIIERPGVSQRVVERVFERLTAKGYIDDVAFARFWVENHNQRKGTSRRKLQAELAAKGIDRSIADSALEASERQDATELDKIISKKAARYPERQKLVAYLARQGFSYDDITTALESFDAASSLQ